MREDLSIRGRSVYFGDSPISLSKLNSKIRLCPINRDLVPWLLVRTFVRDPVLTNYNRQYYEVCSATDNQAPAEFLDPSGFLLLFETSLS